MNGSETAVRERDLRALPLLVDAALLGVAVGLAIWWPTRTLLEAWLLAYLVLAGFAAGSLGLLMIAHLLGEAWLSPVRRPLEAAASTMPLVVALAIPLVMGLDVIYPWTAGPLPDVPLERAAFFSEGFFLLREATVLMVWIGLTALVIRRGEHPWASAIGLVLLAPTAAIFAVDWVSSREPAVWSSLFAFAYAVTQLAGAMALALLVAMLQPGYPEPRRYHSLQRATVTLALLTLWVWFAQFLIVWMANLPHEVVWYLSRAEGGWLWLKLAVVVPALLLSIALLLPTEPGRWRLVAASALLLAQYLGHMLWLLRPASPTTPVLTWADLVVWPAVGLLWVLWFVTVLRWAEPAPEPSVREQRPA